MRIRLRETGGFAPSVKTWELDTAKMVPGDAQVIVALAQQSGIREMQGATLHGAADVKLLHFEIEDDSRAVRRVVFDQLSVPDGVRRLVAFLKKHAVVVDEL